jgi:hypothetical protein
MGHTTMTQESHVVRAKNGVQGMAPDSCAGKGCEQGGRMVGVRKKVKRGGRPESLAAYGQGGYWRTEVGPRRTHPPGPVDPPCSKSLTLSGE